MMLNLSNSKVLVTGGCGFIGSNFIEYIFDNFENVELWNIDKLGVGPKKLFGFLELENGGSIYAPNNPFSDNSYRFLKSDIRNLSDVYHADLFNPDYVFHFAAESHVDRSINSPVSFIENNVIGITKLLNWVKENSPNARVINVSTDEVYGHLGLVDPPFTEYSSLNPRSPYSASKASADLVAKSYAETFGLDIITTRCCNNYGPHQYDEKFIPTIIRSLMEGKKIPVYGNGENVREWIHVDDHNKSILEIAEIGESGEVYNIGSGEEYSNLDIIGLILNILNPDYEAFADYIEFVEDRKGHDFRYAIESVKYERNFELKRFTKALEETVEHYVKKYE